MPSGIRVGTGAIAYNEWKGRFYPRDLPVAEALPFYAQTFSTLEVNSTFYRMPTVGAMKDLAKKAPPGFPIVIKMPQLITHMKRLRNCKAPTVEFFKAMAHLKKHSGPVLLQLPPNFKQDLPRLQDFFTLLPKKIRMAVEFRHSSWFERSVFDFLKEKNAALVFNDTDVPGVPLVSTADWGYLRLRRLAYSDREMRAWVKKIQEKKWKQTFVIFKHEEKATAPALAERFRCVLNAKRLRN